MFDYLMGQLESVKTWIIANKDWLSLLFGSGILLGLLAKIRTVASFSKRLINRSPVIPTDDFPFDIVPPHTDVMAALFPDRNADPLTWRKIPYRERTADGNTLKILEKSLHNHRWLLILGRTGLGKTREALNLLTLMNREGWTVLSLNRSGWVDRPKTFPGHTIKTDRKLVFFLDDLNQKMHGAKSDPRNFENVSMIIPLQTRLLRTLQYFETQCGPGEIRVVATARNERHQPTDGQPSPFDMLEFEEHAFWRHFQIHELPDLGETAAVQLLKDLSTLTTVQIDQLDLANLARLNDGTFENIIANVRRAMNNKERLTPRTFNQTLGGTWSARYHDAVVRYPAAASIYDAVELLRFFEADLTRLVVQATAEALLDGGVGGSADQRRQTREALDYLETAENILTPRDGQIEAKPQRLDPRLHADRLLAALLQIFEKHPDDMLSALSAFAFNASVLGCHDAATVAYKRVLSARPKDAQTWLALGNAQAHAQRHYEAITSFNKAIEVDPKSYWSWYNKGLSESALGKHRDAALSFGRATVLQPSDYLAWVKHGDALKNQLEYEAAAEKYARALRLRPGAIAALRGYRHSMRMAGQDPASPLTRFERGAPDPTDDAGWYEKGNLNHNLGKIEEALSSYQRSTQLNPRNAGAWAACGMALVKLRRYDEAIECLREATAIDPVFYWPIFEWGNALRLKGEHAKAIEKYKEAIRCQSRYPDAWYGRGIALAQMRRFQEAIECYEKAIACEPDFPWVYYDWGDALRLLGYDAKAAGRTADARHLFKQAVAKFDKALEEQEDYADAWYLRGLSLVALKRHDDAFKSYERALALDSDRAWIWRDQGSLLAGMEKHEKACKSLTKAVTLDAKDDRALYLQARSMACLGHYQQALTALRAAEAIKPGTYLEKAKSDKAFATILPALDPTSISSQASELRTAASETPRVLTES